MKILNFISKVENKLIHMSLDPVYMDDNLIDSYSSMPINCGIKGKNAVVTGGGSGIGFAIAQKLISQGCNVVIIGRNKEKLESAVSLLKSEHVYCYSWDFNNTDSLSNDYDKICKKFLDKKIDIWINCHGEYSEWDNKRSFRHVPLEKLNEELNLNHGSIAAVTDYVASQMIQGDEIRHILNISSICASVKSAVYTPYGLSKAGIINTTRNLAQKYEEEGIVINAITPGAVATKLVWNIDKTTNIAYEPNILKRFILPGEIAALAVMMVSSYGNHLNGAVLTASACERI